MNRKDWQNAYGNAPEDFHLRLVDTLDGLEEEKMRKKYKLSTILIAAVIMALLAGGAVAASELGIFRLMKSGGSPIIPLEGAEDLVVTGQLGTVENELATLNVVEAVFDGEKVILQMQITPKDAENHALFNWFTQAAPEDEYEVETNTNGSWSQDSYKRKDGKKIIDYYIGVQETEDQGEVFSSFSTHAEAQPDGSILCWVSGAGNAPMDIDTLKLEVGANFKMDDVDYPMEWLTVEIPRAGEAWYAQIIPVGEQLERVEIVSGGIDFTKVQGWITVGYRYEQLPEELMGISFRYYDAEGNRINIGGGDSWEKDGVKYWRDEIQSFDELPEKIWIEPKVIDGEPLGRIECELVAVPESVSAVVEPGTFG